MNSCAQSTLFKQQQSLMFKGKSKPKQPAPQPRDTKKSLNSQKLAIPQQINQIVKQIEEANQNIKHTENLLDVDLFLRQQKKKRAEHAKNINAQYEAQKKVREQKLYKKHNRKAEQSAEIPKMDPKIENFLNLDSKHNNKIPVLEPLSILKVMKNFDVKSKWIFDGHVFRDQEMEAQSLRQEEERIFEGLYTEDDTDKYARGSTQPQIVWKNAKEVCQNSLKITFLPVQVQEQQLLIGSTENENILNALTLMSPEISQFLYTETENTFSAKMHMAAKPVTVVTDKHILVRQFRHKNVNLGARCHNSNLMWPTLIQKCWMKLQSSTGFKPGKSNSTLLESIYSVYGLDAEIIPVTNKNVIKENFPLVLGHLLQEGRVGLMNIGRAKKCYEGRIYPLEYVREEIAHEHQGQQKSQIRYKVKNPWRGKLLDSQNQNIFNLLQLLGYFNTLVILRSYPERWTCLRINFSYYSNGAVGLSNNEWTKNSQYLFTITKKMSLRVVLRRSGNNFEQQQSEQEYVFGFLLFENKTAQNRIQSMKMDSLLTKTKSNDLNEACYNAEIDVGNYILVPYSTHRSDKAYQFYVLDFVVEKEGGIEFGKARLHEWNYVDQKGSRLNPTEKRIQSLESTEKFQRPKVERMQSNCLIPSKVSKSTLEQLQLNLFEKADLKHFTMPGFIGNLLINKSVETDTANALRRQKKENTVHEELSQEQQAENLSTLLGYDALSDEINQGKMREYIYQSAGAYDFRDYGLGQEGLVAVLESMCQHPQIVCIDLRGNDLTDSAITYLCYYLQKSHRNQLRELLVGRNQFGYIGRSALQGLGSTFPALKISLS